jgi:hypothetical protein
MTESADSVGVGIDLVGREATEDVRVLTARSASRGLDMVMRAAICRVPVVRWKGTSLTAMLKGDRRMARIASEALVQPSE